MESEVKNIIERMKKDNNYVRLHDIYMKEHYVDKRLLCKVLEEHEDFYEVFLKVNVCVYNYDSKKLCKKYRDLFHYGKNGYFYLYDVDYIIREYLSDYSFYRSCIKKIIREKLKPNNELEILKLILKREKERELTYLI